MAFSVLIHELIQTGCLKWSFYRVRLRRDSPLSFHSGKELTIPQSKQITYRHEMDGTETGSKEL